MTTLIQAYKEWAKRPPEERYSSIEQMKEVAFVDRAYALEKNQRSSAHMNVLATANGDLQLTTEVGEYTLNNWTMGQLCAFSKAPKNYLCSLPADLAAQCLTESITTNRRNVTTGLQFFSSHNPESDEHPILRSITSSRYERFYDYDILSYLEELQVDGWITPPQAKGAAPSGLYRGDHSMFVFMINDENRINDGSDGGLSRGFFVSNSEVGGGSFYIKTFLYRHICGNHMVFGCSDIREIRLRHVGRSFRASAVRSLSRDLTIYAQDAIAETEMTIKAAKETIVGKNREDVVEFLFKTIGVTKTNSEKAFDTCVEEEPELDPTSVWGLVQGVTAVARKEDFMSSRIEIEKASKKLMELV